MGSRPYTKHEADIAALAFRVWVRTIHVDGLEVEVPIIPVPVELIHLIVHFQVCHWREGVRIGDQWNRRSNRGWRRTVRWHQVQYQVMILGKEVYRGRLPQASRKRAVIDAPMPPFPPTIEEVQEAQDSDSSYADSLPTVRGSPVYDDDSD